MENLRGTGRTTRLMQDAIKQAEQKRAVYVVVANDNEIDRITREYFDDIKKLGIKIETPATLGRSFDLINMRQPGAHPNCVFLVDHHLIEKQFFKVLEMLHRYDQ